MEKIRRYDLDWLRVIVFGLLIFYHVGMFFVPWGFHTKNNVIYDWIRWPMLFLNQWRLPILFVISGMGTAYALSYRSGGKFIKERFLRLFIPLAVGMFLIVPPQVYVERVVNGEIAGSYISWYFSGQFLNGIYPVGNFSWHHLWFLPYLLVYSLLLTPVFIHLRNHPEGKLLSWVRRRLKANPYFLFTFTIPLFLYESLLEPFFNITHNLVWDWFNFISSMTLFFYGFVLISVKDVFWEAIDKLWKKTLWVGIICFSGLLVIWLFFEDSTIIHFTEAALKVTNFWAWIITIFGLASVYLNKPSKGLAYANQAVYPFYILHQTIMLSICFFIYDKEWGLLVKFSFLTFGTFGFTWLIYEFFIRRIRLIWPLFGLKRR